MSSDDEPTFDAVNDIDSNVWWHLTEERVDDYEKDKFSNQLQILTGGEEAYEGETACFGVVGHHWQFQPVGKNDDTNFTQYALRCSATNILKQLGLCWIEDSDHPEKMRTRPCMVDSDGTDKQRWEVADWGNGTYRFTNAHNGTDYYMDVNPGNPMFMSPDIDPEVYQKAQRWLMTSVKKVDDGAYSTTFTNTPTSTSDVSTTSDSPSSSASEPPPIDSGSSGGGGGGLSAGASAGIGIGAAVGIIAVAGLAFFLWRRRRRPAAVGSHRNPVELDQQSRGAYHDGSPKGVPSSENYSSNSPHQDYYNNSNNSTSPPQQAQQYQPHAHEMEGNLLHHELDTEAPRNPQEFPR